MNNTLQYLLIGDLHCKRSNLAESERILRWCWETSLQHRAIPVFLGDLYDEHAIAYVEVFRLLHEQFYQASKLNLRPIVVMGNHDANLDCTAHWLTAHSQYIDIVDAPLNISDSIHAIPFRRSVEHFINDINMVPKSVKIVLCHQEFIGSQLTNAFYSTNGVDISYLPSDILVISGHIHRQQKLYRTSTINHNNIAVYYIGAARHLTRNDVGQKNQVALLGLPNADITMIDIPTAISKPHLSISICPDTNLENINLNDYTYIDIHGDKDFISRINPLIPHTSKCRTFLTSASVVHDIKESDGIVVAFGKFLKQYQKMHNLSDDTMSEVANLIYQYCDILKV